MESADPDRLDLKRSPTGTVSNGELARRSFIRRHGLGPTASCPPARPSSRARCPSTHELAVYGLSARPTVFIVDDLYRMPSISRVASLNAPRMGGTTERKLNPT